MKSIFNISKKSIRLLCLILALLVFATLLGCESDPPAQSDTIEEDVKEFDPSMIQLSFGAISDTHLGDKDTEESFRNILSYIQEVNGSTPDLYMVSGDITNTTAKTEEKTEIRLFKNVFEETTQESPLLYCLGPSHDVPSGAPAENLRMLYYSTFGSSYYENDLEPSSMLAKGFRHIKIKDYHFFAIDWSSSVDKKYSQEDLNWLENELKAAAEENKDKPIFISTHVPVVDQLKPIFAKYPQIFCFTGHVHNSVAREDSISQDLGFTSVHCGAVAYYRVDGYNRFYKADNPYLNLGNIYDFAQGLVVQVDANQNVRITRVDGHNKTTIGNAWDIPTGNITKYTNERKNSAKNCSFDDSAKIKIEVPNSTSLRISFDAANSGDAGPAQYYMVELLTPDANGKYQVLQHAEMSSQQVFYPNDKNIPDYHYSHTFTDINCQSDFAVVVTAWDCWDSSENALVYTNGTFVYDGLATGNASVTLN